MPDPAWITVVIVDFFVFVVWVLLLRGLVIAVLSMLSARRIDADGAVAVFFDKHGVDAVLSMLSARRRDADGAVALFFDKHRADAIKVRHVPHTTVARRVIGLSRGKDLLLRGLVVITVLSMLSARRRDTDGTVAVFFDKHRADAIIEVRKGHVPHTTVTSRRVIAVEREADSAGNSRKSHCWLLNLPISSTIISILWEEDRGGRKKILPTYTLWVWEEEERNNYFPSSSQSSLRSQMGGGEE
jgi:hypothetical protein